MFKIKFKLFCVLGLFFIAVLPSVYAADEDGLTLIGSDLSATSDYINLYYATSHNDIVGRKYTVADIGSGSSIGLYKVLLMRTGTLTGDPVLVGRIRLQSDDSIVTNSTNSYLSSEISTSKTRYSFFFADGNPITADVYIVIEMTPADTYASGKHIGFGYSTESGFISWRAFGGGWTHQTVNNARVGLWKHPPAVTYFLTTTFLSPISSITLDSLSVSNNSLTEYNNTDIVEIEAITSFHYFVFDGNTSYFHINPVNLAMSANHTVIAYPLDIPANNSGISILIIGIVAVFIIIIVAKR